MFSPAVAGEWYAGAVDEFCSALAMTGSTLSRRLVAITIATFALTSLNVTSASADPTNTTSFTPATSVDNLRLTPGRLWYTTASSTSAVSLYRRAVDTTTTPTTLGAPAGPWSIGPVLAGSGTRVAYAETSNTTLDIADAATMSVQRRYALPAGYTDVRLSGQKLSIASASSVNVVEMPTGVRWTLPVGATVSGRYAAWFNADGSITRKDLLTGTEQTVRAAGGATACNQTLSACLPTNSPTALKMHNEWLVWRLDCEVGAKNMTTGFETQALSTTANCIRHFHLLDGWLVYQQPSTNAVFAQQLSCFPSCAAVSVVGSAVGAFSVQDHALAWTNTTNSTVSVGALPFSYTSYPWLLDEYVPAAFSPIGNGIHTWSPEFDVSAPLSSWALTIKNASGTVITTLSGSAPYSAATPAWNGTVGGVVQPDGVYSWALSGQDTKGNPLRGSDGVTGQLSGTVVIKEQAPSAVMHAPVLSTSNSTTTSFPISWAASNVPGWAGYRVTGYDVQVHDNGTVRSVASNTAATSVSFSGTQGHTYQFTVRTRDNAGNVGAWSTSVTTTVPLDDRNAALVYAGTWSSDVASPAFLGTERESGSAGNTASLTASMRTFTLIVTRCTSCGAVRVYVDGSYLTSVDTYAANTLYRQAVYTRAVGSTVGTHTVKLVVVGTAGRPRLYLDAVAVTR